ncbi:MAG: nucleotidyltransferase domain-containing protein [Polyangiaceae bacterium]|nr:nucleotidyltransferase domain-containing protein [Polyangiaceae bacterium]
MNEGAPVVDERAIFARVAAALKPYLNHLIFVGGWAHRLYEIHPNSSPLDFSPLATLDADLATPPDLPVIDRPINVLLEEVGFKEHLGGEANPPVSRYELGEGKVEFEVEFITPLRGSEYKKGKPDATVTVAGITAQKLRYVDLLQVSPWPILLSEELGYPVGAAPLRIQVPNPVSFIAQKTLALQYRSSLQKKAKDILYVHDTLHQFRMSFLTLRAEWNVVRDHMHPTTAKKFKDSQATIFTEHSAFVQLAASIARSTGRPHAPSAGLLAATIRTAFGEIFVDD